MSHFRGPDTPLHSTPQLDLSPGRRAMRGALLLLAACVIATLPRSAGLAEDVAEEMAGEAAGRLESTLGEGRRKHHQELRVEVGRSRRDGDGDAARFGIFKKIHNALKAVQAKKATAAKKTAAVKVVVVKAKNKINPEACTVSGLIRGSKWGHVATLPATCRPSKRLIFNLNNHGKNARVDVDTNGQVIWVAGGRDHGWLSLTGIAFPVAGSAESVLPLANGWKAYGSTYGTPTYAILGKKCSVTGLIKGGDWNKPAATLPAQCRPSKRLIFNLNNHEYT